MTKPTIEDIKIKIVQYGLANVDIHYEQRLGRSDRVLEYINRKSFIFKEIVQMVEDYAEARANEIINGSSKNSSN